MTLSIKKFKNKEIIKNTSFSQQSCAEFVILFKNNFINTLTFNNFYKLLKKLKVKVCFQDNNKTQSNYNDYN